MLKSLDTTKFQFQHCQTTKCAEVFFQNKSEFIIVCTLCDVKNFNLQDFGLHYRNVHVNEPIVPKRAKKKHKVDTRYLECEFVKDQNDQLLGYEDEGAPPHISIMKVKTEDVVLEQEIEMKKEDVDRVKDDENSRHDFDDASDPNEDNWNSHSEESEQEDEYTPQVIKKKNEHMPKTFQCTICFKKYCSAKSLAQHSSQAHNPNGAFKCSQCEQTFSCVRLLNAHTKRAHDGFKCDFAGCEKSYKCRDSLNAHKYSHSGVRQFKCKVESCGKMFFNPKHALTHARQVHNPNRQYICELCAYQTKNKSALVVHMRSHTGERPFVCKICGKGFGSKALLNDHQPIHSSERPFKCDVCNATFSRPKALYHHKHLHLGIKKFVCKLCGRAYAQAAGLAGHMRQHRQEQEAIMAL